MICWYCLSAAVVSSGAFRYFSKRAWNTRLLLTFQVLPSHVSSSLPGSNTGTSLPRKSLPLLALRRRGGRLRGLLRGGRVRHLCNNRSRDEHRAARGDLPAIGNWKSEILKSCYAFSIPRAISTPLSPTSTRNMNFCPFWMFT